MNDALSAFLEARGPVLALDIGSGTQDVLLALPDSVPENWPRFVLPAPARRVAARVRALTEARRPVWLCGSNMGGGFFQAVTDHLARGLPVAATLEASAALHDDPDRVRAAGVTIADTRPDDHAPVFLSDYDPGFWNAFLSSAALPPPALVTAAAQDHGVHADMGNREGRFRLWRELLARSEGEPARWLYAVPPAACTRLASLSRAIGGGPTADTGAAAVLGALSMPEVAERSDREGVLVVNVGNSHTLGFLVFRRRILGVYEHHTGLLSTEKLLKDLDEFRRGWLPDEQVRAAGGHGCIMLDPPAEAEGFRPAFILGPRRELLAGHGSFIAPHGDMMLAGCHGLLHGLALQAAARG
ncbi:MAG: hypothetical protein DBX67_05815 [Desulfovibrionaceae bacterium]|nr:DUF1786 domain-containing protein [Desulfovibrionaceae bacterium]PWM68594.1 MAG: hypothetical protein DBX67_05815 [Desulfovibrionaceae bacterium]